MFFIVLLFGISLSMIKDKKRIYFLFFALVLAVLAYIRYGIGSDYFAYRYLFHRLNTNILQEFLFGLDQQEIGFRLIGAFLKKIGVTYEIYLMLIATINIVFISKICLKYSKNPIMSMLLYYCFYYLVWTFSGIRQGITIPIGIYYLLEYLECKNLRKFVIIVLALSLIHQSTIILLPLTYLVVRMNLGKKDLIKLSLLGMFVSILPLGIIVNKLTFIPVFSRIAPYLSNNYSLLSFLDFQSLGRIVFMVIAFIYYDSLAKQSETSKNILNLYIISLILYFLFKFSELTAARLSIYGKILDIIILPNIFYLYKDKINKTIYLAGLCLMCTLFLYKEIYTMQIQSGITFKGKVVPAYTNIYNEENYHFNNIYKNL